MSFANQIKAENNKKNGNVDYVKLISQKRQKEKLQETDKKKFIEKIKPISKRTSTKLIDYVDIDEEIKISIDNYSKMTAEEMEKLLPGRSKHSIHKKAEHLISAKYIKMEFVNYIDGQKKNVKY